MSLTASMWTSVSGLLAHGEKMNVVGNNISNVNTVGYKSQRMDFQDFVYQYTGTANGMGQVGRGTTIGIIMNDFSQGSLETTTNSTDIAIEGNGFFKVKPLNNNVSYYTRAGNFYFNNAGYLVDPNGYALQGWAIDPRNASTTTSSRTSSGIIGSGSPVDIKLETFTCPPKHTTSVTLPMNLAKSTSAATDDKSTDATDPFFALLKTWDATQDPPLGQSQYAHQTTMEVYDEAGRLHKLTIYFDRVANDNGGQTIANNSEGESYWEFIVTMDPSEDMRDFASTYDPSGSAATTPNVPDKLKGLLGAGTITFNSSGDMKDMTMFVPQTDPADGTWWDGSDNVDLDKWVSAPFDSNGFPMIAPNFSGTAGQQTAYEDGVWDRPNANAQNRLISINFGLQNTSKTWAFQTGTDPVQASAVASDKNNIIGLDGFGKVQSNYSTCYGENFYDKPGHAQDGYSYGDLRSVQVGSNGVLSASYSNGQTLQLFQIVLYDFPSTQNLRREGGNLYSETLESGPPSSGAPGTGAFGTTQGYSIEQSNADLTREFVNMITTQRGFQANSKTITTVDTMLETVISMKR